MRSDHVWHERSVFVLKHNGDDVVPNVTFALQLNSVANINFKGNYINTLSARKGSVLCLVTKRIHTMSTFKLSGFPFSVFEKDAFNNSGDLAVNF